GLRLAEWMRARDSSGKTSLFDLKLRADARVNAQALGQRLQQQIRRARKQDDEMTRALMPAEPIDGFRRQTRLDLALEAFPRQAPETDGIFTAQVGFYRVQSRSARGGGSPPGGGSYGCDDPVDHIPPTQFAAPSEKPDEDSFERRIGDERAVNIENCSNPSFFHFSNRPQVSAEKSEALDDHRDAARHAENDRGDGQAARSDSQAVHQNIRPAGDDGPPLGQVRERQPQSERDERRAFANAVSAAAPARTRPKTPPPRPHHRLFAECGLPLRKRDGAQEIGKPAARDHDHRNPECDQSRRREVDPEDALDNPVRRDVESRSDVARATLAPRHDTVSRVERERDDQ